MSVFVSKSLKDGSYDRIFDNTFNACKIAEAVAGNFLLKAFLDKFDESSDHELKCPFKKVIKKPKAMRYSCSIFSNFQGTYNNKNLLISDKFIPIFMKNKKFRVLYRVLTKSDSKQNLIPLYSAKITAVLK